MSTSCNKMVSGVLIGFVVMATAAVNVLAESAHQLVTEGNQAYQNKKYDDALKAYDKAAVQEPNSPYIEFDKGTVYYQKGDFAKAKNAFENAALKTKDLSMEARCKYNLGSCFFSEAQGKQNKEGEKALADYETSIQCYQAALRLDPKFQDAAHNIEVSRLAMKRLLDLKKQQQEKSEQEKKERKESEEKLKKLIDQQQKNMQENKKLDSQKAQTQPTQEMKQRSQELAEQQKKIKEETKELAQKMAKPDQQKQSKDSPEQKSAEHLERSAQKQEKAENQLRKEESRESQASQKEALDEMQKALKELSEPQQNQQDKKDKQGEQGKQDPQDKKNQQEQKEKQATSQPASQAKQKEQNKDQKKAQIPRNEEARDILNQEKESRQERGQEIQGGYQPVEKDW